MEDNLKLWNEVRSVPDEAKKQITGGRLNGMTDINPTFRLKTLTEIFGMCGVGWYYNITDKRLEQGTDGVISCFVQIELFVKVGNEWSKPIIGVGGSAFVSKEKNGLYTSDECEKMALTDAISVSCKALGIGADVYWAKDRTKYDNEQSSKAEQEADMKEQNMLNNVAMCTTIQEAKELCAKYKGEFRNVNLLLEVYRKKEKELNGNI